MKKRITYKKNIFLVLLLCASLTVCTALAATGCSANLGGDIVSIEPTDYAVTPASTADAGGTAQELAVVAASGDYFSDADLDPSYDEVKATKITLADGKIIVDGDGVTTAESAVNITSGGTYIVTGTLQDGKITVDAAETDKVRLVLYNASITSATDAAINVKSADKVFLIIPAGTESTLCDGTTRADEEIAACVYSTSDVTIQGTGTLNVTGSFKGGIVTKDDLTLVGTTINVKSATVGIKGRDEIAAAEANVTITSGGDGMKANNDEDAAKGVIYVESGTYNITAETDGIQAVSLVTIAGGTLDIACGDDAVHADSTLNVSGGKITVSKCYEGLEAAYITISGGDTDITASDDGINSAGGNDGSGSTEGRRDMFAATDGYINISGGTLRVDAGGDGLDSNGALNVTGGLTLVSGPTNSGNGALDYTSNGTITGGTLIATGMSGMAMNMDDNSTQCSVMINLAETQAAGTTVALVDSTGAEVASFTPAKQYNSVVISCPEIAKDAEYTLKTGTDDVLTFTQSSTIVSLNSDGSVASGMGMMGGMGGMGGGKPGRPGGMDGTAPADGTIPDGTMPDGTPPTGEMPAGTPPADWQGGTPPTGGMGGTPPDGTVPDGTPPPMPEGGTSQG